MRKESIGLLVAGVATIVYLFAAYALIRIWATVGWTVATMLAIFIVAPLLAAQLIRKDN